METDRIKFCCDCTNKNCPEQMPDPNSMACSFFIGKENVCKNCKHFAPKTTHCKKGVPWISEDDSCNNFEQKTKMTNGDKIRQMSNERIAAFVCGALNDRTEETFRSVLDLLNARRNSEVENE